MMDVELRSQLLRQSHAHNTHIDGFDPQGLSLGASHQIPAYSSTVCPLVQ